MKLPVQNLINYTRTRKLPGLHLTPKHQPTPYALPLPFTFLTDRAICTYI
ncbi:hypothetical protein E2C01_079722 [Portunus trituberculatus]|uniref:Uncharacterized protein n=1 Tax=Portunus trituberculatus TaxID=210409 RepID=A0A5B7IU36_PORTR|nr:hypothetical protein [Portunus trituberculatus]